MKKIEFFPPRLIVHDPAVLREHAEIECPSHKRVDYEGSLTSGRRKLLEVAEEQQMYCAEVIGPRLCATIGEDGQDIAY